jgi:hypothetical protein
MIYSVKIDKREHQNKNIPIKILLAFFSIWLVFDIPVLHLVNSTIFWVMAIIEVGIGILFSKNYYRFRNDKKYTRSNFLFLPLLVIGIAAPIIIYFISPSLGRVDAALVVFFVAMDASALHYSKIEALKNKKIINSK